MSRTLSPTKRKKLDWVTTICTLTGTGFPLNPSIKVNTSCPPSNRGKGNELSTAKLIEINVRNKVFRFKFLMISIINYELGNVISVQNALNKLGYKNTITRDENIISN